MPITSVAGLIDALRGCPLLTPVQFDELTRLLQAQFSDPHALAMELVQRGWLMPYQVNRLLQGCGPDLLLGPYVLLEPLGEGGMGQVFKARHQKLERVVALKLIRKEWLAHPDAVRRFRREIQAAAQLTHPNVVYVYDADQAGDTHFFAMEYVKGIDLAKLVKQSGPLAVPQACDYMRQAGLGLQHAQERGLVHRDIKPANLLVGAKGVRGEALLPHSTPPALLAPWGVVKILDMGLVHLVQAADDGASSSFLTQEGTLLGTLDYLAPEQALDCHSVDIRADLYSLGCSFYYLLTGRAPFPGGSAMEKLLKHRLEEPLPVDARRPEVPAAVAAVVHKLMAKRPEGRYQTPAELVAVLASLADTGPGAGREDPILADERVASAAAVPLANLPNAASGDAFTCATVEMAPPGQHLAVTLRRRHRVVLASVLGGCILLGLPALVWVALFQERLPSAVNPQRPVPPTEPLAVNADWPLGEIRRFEGHKEPVFSVAFSRDGHRAASGGGVTWQDGKWLPGSDHAIRLWDVDIGQELLRLAGHTHVVKRVLFAADGRRLLSSSWDHTVRIWDVDTGQQLHCFPGRTDENEGADWSPDGRQVLSAMGSTVQLWDAATGRVIRTLTGHGSRINSVVFSPDGRLALSTSNDSTLRLWDLGTGQEVRRFTGHTSGVRRAVFAPDGRLVLSLSSDQTVRLWDAASAQELKHFVGHSAFILCVAISPDGRRALTGSQDGTARLWDLESGTEVHRFAGHGHVHGVAFAPDSRRALITRTDGVVRLIGLPE